MFYLKYLFALVAFVIVAIKAPIATRTLQQTVNWGLDQLEVHCLVPAQYMVAAELLDIGEKLAFLLFALLFFTSLKLVKIVLQRGLRKISLKRKRQSA